MASAGYDIQISRQQTSTNSSLASGAQLSARTDFGGSVYSLPTAINGVTLNHVDIENYVDLMVVSQGAMDVTGTITAQTGTSYAGTGSVQTAWLIDGSLTGDNNYASWAASVAGSPKAYTTNTTLTTTYSTLDVAVQPPQAGAQWFNNSAGNASVNLRILVTGRLTGYWAAALLV